MHLTLFAFCELKVANLQGKQRIIVASPDILAGMDMRSALADNDIARLHKLAGKLLNAETLRPGVASVS
jgi:hypothetical protein